MKLCSAVSKAVLIYSILPCTRAEKQKVCYDILVKGLAGLAVMKSITKPNN